MSEPTGSTRVDWTCECGTSVTLSRLLRLGESAAEQAASNTGDLDAIRKRHKHEPKERSQ